MLPEANQPLEISPLRRISMVAPETRPSLRERLVSLPVCNLPSVSVVRAACFACKSRRWQERNKPPPRPAGRINSSRWHAPGDRCRANSHINHRPGVNTNNSLRFVMKAHVHTRKHSLPVLRKRHANHANPNWDIERRRLIMEISVSHCSIWNLHIVLLSLSPIFNWFSRFAGNEENKTGK